ncbi:MAG: hypothetical protein ACTHMM_26995 [Agriterribacter sp.]
MNCHLCTYYTPATGCAHYRPVTAEDILKDNDYASKLILPQIRVYLIYRGGNKVEYYVFRNGSILFAGNDFKPSPLHDIDGIEAIMDLLAFITTKEGDTDSEYFENYTPVQMEWTRSIDCEDVSLLAFHYENADSSGHKVAVRRIKKAFTYGN